MCDDPRANKLELSLALTPPNTHYSLPRFRGKFARQLIKIAIMTRRVVNVSNKLLWFKIVFSIWKCDSHDIMYKVKRRNNHQSILEKLNICKRINWISKSATDLIFFLLYACTGCVKIAFGNTILILVFSNFVASQFLIKLRLSFNLLNKLSRNRKKSVFTAVIRRSPKMISRQHLFV